jgi:hypothetical protein
MSQTAAKPQTETTQMPAAASIERRIAARHPVIRSARVRIGQGAGQAVYECLVLDESPTGVLVDFGSVLPVPEDVSVHFVTGGSYLARRRWAMGTKAGFEFCGEQLISRETADRIRKLADILETQGVLAAVRTLRAARFYDHTALQTAAEDAEVAYLRFANLLANA